MNIKDQTLKDLYKRIQRWLLVTDAYTSFATDILLNKEIYNLFVSNGKLDVSYAKEILSDLDCLRDICCNKITNKETEFYDFITKSVDSLYISDMQKVIYKYMLDTKYGNPKRQNDFTATDRLFYVLQAIFGLDSLIKSCFDNSVLKHRFYEVTNLLDENDYDSFEKTFSDIKKELEKATTDNELNDLFDAKKELLRDYVASGILKQYDEVSNAPSGNFIEVDEFLKFISEDLGFSIKNNVK